MKKNSKFLYVVIFAVLVSVFVIFLWQKNTYVSEIGKFKNGQEYSILKSEDFEIKYPKWKDIEKQILLEPEKIILAVTSKECVFSIDQETFEEEMSLNEYFEKYSTERIKELGSRIKNRGIDQGSLYFEEILPGGMFNYRNFSRIYQINSKKLYKISLIGEEVGFMNSCFPVLEEIFSSVKIKEPIDEK